MGKTYIKSGLFSRPKKISSRVRWLPAYACISLAKTGGGDVKKVAENLKTTKTGATKTDLAKFAARPLPAY